MGTFSLQVKDCTSTAYDYLQNKSDKNLVALQKQLHSLSLISDLEMFEPSTPEILELFLCLEYFLTPTEARSAVAGKVLTLFIHISESSFIRNILRDDLKIVPVVSKFLRNSKLSKDNLFKTLNLLSIISYRIKIVNMEGWIMELIPFLVTTITEGSVGDECLLFALQTLGNLCRSNPPVVESLSRLPNNKMLLETLFRMKNATMYVRLLILEILFFIDFKKIDAYSPFNEILDVIFSVAIDGFEENRSSWLQLAADVFEELSIMPSLEQVFREYKSHGTHLQLLLGRLMSGSSESLAEGLLAFVYSLVKFSHQDIRSLHETILSKVTEWIHSQRCGETAVLLIRELLISTSTSTIPSTCMDNFVEAIKMCLASSEGSEMTFAKLQHIVIILALVDNLSSNEALQLKFAWKLEPSLFSNLLKKALILDSNCMVIGQQQRMSSSDVILTASSDSSASRPGIATNQAEESGVGRCDLKFSQRKILSKTIVLILSFTKRLSSVKSEHLAEYKKMMGTPAVMKHLVWVVQSGLKEDVTRAWTIISDGSLSNECLDALATTVETPSREEAHYGSQARIFNSRNLMATVSPDFEEKVNTMIARLAGTVRKKEFQDCSLTDVMNLYEYKLASLAHSEQFLQEALMKADTQNRHSHLLCIQANTQNDHLRSLLLKWESRLQKVQEEKTELITSIEEIKESSREFRENFISEKQKLERKTDDMKKELMAMKVSSRTIEEKNTKLQQQLSNKMEELKSQQIQIQEEQEKGLKMSKQLQKLEGELKQGTKTMEAMKEEIGSLESVKLQLSKENNDLELLVKSKDETLAAKEEELEETTIKLKKMVEIQHMIHDMSSRTVMK